MTVNVIDVNVNAVALWPVVAAGVVAFGALLVSAVWLCIVEPAVRWLRRRCER
jgi:hypothetical protein